MPELDRSRRPASTSRKGRSRCPTARCAGRDVRASPHAGAARRLQGDHRRDPGRTQRRGPRPERPLLRLQQRRPGSRRPTWTASCSRAGRPNYIGGRIQTVDPATGAVTDLYTECNGNPLLAPNDLVFDTHGGFYFTDHGFVDDEARIHKLAGIYYAQADGSGDHRGRVPVATTPTGSASRPTAPSCTGPRRGAGASCNATSSRRARCRAPTLVDPEQCLYGFPGLQLLDSLAIDGAGNVCVATIVNGGVSVISPAGELVEFVATGDLITTNICFGGADLTHGVHHVVDDGSTREDDVAPSRAPPRVPEHVNRARCRTERHRRSRN